MNYLPFVSWGVFGAESDSDRANGFAFWGLLLNLSAPIPGAIRRLIKIGHELYLDMFVINKTKQL